MSTLRGVDASDNQDAALPWPEWYAAGGRVAVLRALVGFWQDLHFSRYVAEAGAAGFLVGAYDAILGHVHYDTLKQAQDFVDLMTAAIQFIVLDVEAPGVSDQDVLTWVEYVKVNSPLPLILYGNWDLAGIIGRHPELLRFSVWWAGYPTFPNPCSEPPWPFPRNVPPFLVERVGAWQFAGDNGVFKPYTKPIDLTDWYWVPGPLPPAPGEPLDRIDAAVADIRIIL